MTDTATQTGMNPALKIILTVALVLLGLLCVGGALAGWLVWKGVDVSKTAMQRAQTSAILEQAAGVISEQYRANGELPASAPDLGTLDGHPMVVIDAWGHEIIYTRAPDGRSFDLVSLGADGVEGGEGADADVVQHVTVGD